MKFISSYVDDVTYETLSFKRKENCGIQQQKKWARSSFLNSMIATKKKKKKKEENGIIVVMSGYVINSLECFVAEIKSTNDV